MRAQDVNNRDFISIMNPDDPYAVPRMIPYRTPVDGKGKKLSVTEEIEEKFDKDGIVLKAGKNGKESSKG